MALPEAILRQIEVLRGLEAAAEADPGYEADHDHESTAAYNAYFQALTALTEALEALPQPEGWLDLEAWCQGHRFEFGNIVYPGAHWAKMRWNPKAVSLQGL